MLTVAGVHPFVEKCWGERQRPITRRYYNATVCAIKRILIT